MNTHEKISLFFLIRSLGHGGAERQLTELVKRLDVARFQITVATFYDGGALRPEIEGLPGVRVLSLAKKSRWDVLGFLWRLTLAIREARPQIIHGYLGIANELALIAGRAFGARVVWGMRMSQMDYSQADWASVASFKLGAWLSRYTDLMIANSHVGREHYAKDGYDPGRMVVVSNGINTSRFQPDPAASARMRREWRLGPEDQVIGLVGRINPQKDHQTFLHAAAILSTRRARVRFVCVGDGPCQYRKNLERLARELELNGTVHWAGPASDMNAVYNALDVVALPSAYGEGFANVVGEAMACGVPVVATDVGDAALIVGNPAQVVPPRQPEALARAWERILDLSPEEREALGRAQRERILNEFSLDQLTHRTVALLEALR